MAESAQGKVIIPLSSILKTIEARSEVNRALLSFKCSKNKDEESFLHNKAINFEELNKARTYLIFDSDYEKLLGYITLAFKSIELKNVSTSKRKSLTAGENTETYAAFLIGHLAKNSNYKEMISGEEILKIAEDIIYKAQKLVGGRLIYIDCKDNESLISFYNKNDFKYFNTSKETGLLQFYKKI